MRFWSGSCWQFCSVYLTPPFDIQFHPIMVRWVRQMAVAFITRNFHPVCSFRHLFVRAFICCEILIFIWEVNVMISSVRSFGTEARPTDRPVAPRDEVLIWISLVLMWWKKLFHLLPGVRVHHIPGRRHQGHPGLRTS